MKLGQCTKTLREDRSYDRPPLPCCLVNKEQSAVKARESEVGSIAPLFRSSCTDWLRDDHLRTPWGMWSLVPEAQWRQRHKGDLVPPLYDAHNPKVCTYLGPSPPPPPRILIASRLFSRVIGPKFVQLMGAPPVPSCTPASERQGRSGPFLLHGLFPYGRIARRKRPLTLNLTLPRPVG